MIIDLIVVGAASNIVDLAAVETDEHRNEVSDYSCYLLKHISAVIVLV